MSPVQNRGSEPNHYKSKIVADKPGNLFGHGKSGNLSCQDKPRNLFDHGKSLTSASGQGKVCVSSELMAPTENYQSCQAINFFNRTLIYTFCLLHFYRTSAH